MLVTCWQGLLRKSEAAPPTVAGWKKDNSEINEHLAALFLQEVGHRSYNDSDSDAIKAMLFKQSARLKGKSLSRANLTLVR